MATNIAFRVDASPEIGTGHLVRCLALAEILLQKGAQVLFLCKALPQSFCERVMACEGLSLVEIPEGVDEAKHCIDCLKANGVEWDWLIVDHYGLDDGWERQMRPVVRHLMVIDDLANRVHDCDALLDQNEFPAPEERYAGKVPPTTRLLLGPRYALLRESFLLQQPVAREGVPTPSRDINQAKKLLVSFGGADPAGATWKVLLALSESRLAGVHIMVIAAELNPDIGKIEALASQMSGVTCYRHVDNMAALMLEADLFIGSGGTTTWERMLLGLPGLVIAIAENQWEMSQALANFGCQVYLGKLSEVSALDIQNGVAFCLSQPGLCRVMAERGLTKVDGKGCHRVASVLLAPPLSLRLAEAGDAAVLFHWRNHAETLRWSFHSEPVVWEDHQQWLQKSLLNPNRLLLIAEIHGQPVGVLRYDVTAPSVCQVSITLAPGLSGQGMGTRIFEAGTAWLEIHRPELCWIRAEIMEANRASRRAIEKAGYTQRHIVYEKRLMPYDRTGGRQQDECLPAHC